MIKFAEFARKNGGHLQGIYLEEYYKQMQLDFQNANSRLILKRLERTGLVIDERAWEEETSTGTTLNIDYGMNYSLDPSYDDFERVVLLAYNPNEK